MIRVKLLSYTKNPEETCVAAIRQCYSEIGAFEIKKNITEQLKKRLLKQVIASGHTSTLEHANFTFGIEGVGRATEIQLVRHRIASYSIKSGRYNKSHADFVIPKAMQNNKKALKVIKKFKKNLENLIFEFRKMGFKYEDIRNFTPQGTKTNIVVTMNSRSLLNFFEKRLCTRAQLEICEMAKLMLEQVKKIAPNIFKYAGPSCKTQKICWEGDLSCNLYKTIKNAELKSRC